MVTNTHNNFYYTPQRSRCLYTALHCPLRLLSAPTWRGGQDFAFQIYLSYFLIINNNNYYYYNGLILSLYPVLCRFKRDFYSVSRGSRDISVLLSLFQYFFQCLFLFQYLLIKELYIT